MLSTDTQPLASQGVSVQINETYGAAFARNLTALGKNAPFRYKDLQRIKAMTRADLAEWYQNECNPVSRVVLENPPEVAAQIIHRMRIELLPISRRMQGVLCVVLLFDLLADQLSALL